MRDITMQDGLLIGAGFDYFAYYAGASGAFCSGLANYSTRAALGGMGDKGYQLQDMFISGLGNIAGFTAGTIVVAAINKIGDHFTAPIEPAANS